MLCDLGLKEGGIWERGGWKCYITNVIKQVAIVADVKNISLDDRRRAAIRWSKVLQWELDNVRPTRIFCVGNKAHDLVKWLRANGPVAHECTLSMHMALFRVPRRRRGRA